MLTFDAVRSLISQSRFGVYFLYNFMGGELLASFPDDDTPDASKSSDLVADLETKLNYLGEGDYKIVLKKTRASNGENSKVTYRFTTKQPGSPAKGGAPDLAGFAGMGMVKADQVDEKIKLAVEAALRTEREKFELERKMDTLQRQIEELRKAPPSNQLMAGIDKTLRVGMGIALAKLAPESIPVVMKMLGETDEEEEEMEPRQVERTD